MAANPNINGNIGLMGQGTDLVPITPSDSTDLALVARAIRCSPAGAAGTLRFTAYNGQVRNTSIALGETLQVIAIRVHAAGTTATGLEAYI